MDLLEYGLAGIENIVDHWVADYKVLLILILFWYWHILLTKVDSIGTDVTFGVLSLFEKALAAVNTDNVLEAHWTKDFSNLSFATTDVKDLLFSLVIAVAEATD